MKIRLLIGDTAYQELTFPRETKTSRFFLTVSSLICSAQSDKRGKNNKYPILFFLWWNIIDFSNLLLAHIGKEMVFCCGMNGNFAMQIEGQIASDNRNAGMD